jgi:hypothetical protein
MTSDEWNPAIGDMVQVILQNIPSVGIIVSVHTDTIIVKGAWWQESFSRKEVTYLHPESDEGEEEC